MTTAIFSLLGLNDTLLKALEEAGFHTPSPIQQQAIPKILEGHDLIAQAQTGTGKTAAFCLPAAHHMKKKSGITFLVLTPTRELAQQVCEEFNRFGKSMDLQAVAIYGGQPITRQLKKLREGVNAIVATPGRLLDLLRSKKLSPFNPSLVVLDEADEMLDMGFLEDIQSIFTFLPKKRQTLFFSATMPKPIQDLANKLLNKPITIKALKQKQSQNTIEQLHYLIRDHERDMALVRLIDSHSPDKAIIFCQTKKETDKLFNYLLTLGYPVRTLHGDMEQKQRQDAIHAFKRGNCRFLIATDIAGRGLDVPDISHVFNYHLPFTSEAHTHRIGRTGRAGKSGVAITLISPSDLRKVKKILKINREEINPRPIPTLSEVRQNHQNKFIESIKNQIVKDNTQEMYRALKEHMDPEQICLNLLSAMMGKQKSIGPESIGLSTLEIKETLAFRSSKKQKKPKRFSKRKFRS